MQHVALASQAQAALADDAPMIPEAHRNLWGTAEPTAFLDFMKQGEVYLVTKARLSYAGRSSAQAGC